MTNEEILKTLTYYSNAEYAEKIRQQLPTDVTYQVIGTPIKTLSELARELACRNEWHSIVKQLPDYYFETILLQAFIFLKNEKDIETLFDWLRDFLKKTNCPLLCDYACLAFTAAQTWPEETLVFLNECLQSENEMSVRFAIVTLLDYFTTSDHSDTTLDIFGTINASRSAMRLKALAWGYRVCFMSFPKRTFNALKVRTPKDDTELIIQEMLATPRFTHAERESLLSLVKPFPHS